jgi:hypothetical protein
MFSAWVTAWEQMDRQLHIQPWLSHPSGLEGSSHTMIHLHLLWHADRIAQIPGTTSPSWLNVVLWHLILVGFGVGTCFMSPFWCLNFGVAHKFLANLFIPALRVVWGSNLKFQVFWDLVLCYWQNSFQYFEELCLHHRLKLSCAVIC